MDPTTNGSSSPSLLHRMVALDAAVSLRIHGLFEPIIGRRFLRALELSGDGRLWFPVPLSLLVLAGPTGLPLALLLGSIIDVAVVALLKLLVRRPRPVYNRGMTLVVSVDHWSFPSGHSSRVFFISSFLSLALDASRQGLVACVALWAAATSASRVLLGRHFVLDVIAGACLGLLEGFLVFFFYASWIGDR